MDKLKSLNNYRKKLNKLFLKQKLGGCCTLIAVLV
jgi:hypothetical protein